MSEAAFRFMKAHIRDLKPGESHSFEKARLRDAGYREGGALLKAIGCPPDHYDAKECRKTKLITFTRK